MILKAIYYRQNFLNINSPLIILIINKKTVEIIIKNHFFISPINKNDIKLNTMDVGKYCQKLFKPKLFKFHKPKPGPEIKTKKIHNEKK